MWGLGLGMAFPRPHTHIHTISLKSTSFRPQIGRLRSREGEPAAQDHTAQQPQGLTPDLLALYS